MPAHPHDDAGPQRAARRGDASRSRTLANLSLVAAVAAIAAGVGVRAVGVAAAVGAAGIAVSALREARRTGGGGRGQAIAALLLAPIAAAHWLAFLAVPAMVVFAGGLFADAGVDVADDGRNG